MPINSILNTVLDSQYSTCVRKLKFIKKSSASSTVEYSEWECMILMTTCGRRAISYVIHSIHSVINPNRTTVHVSTCQELPTDVIDEARFEYLYDVLFIRIRSIRFIRLNIITVL